MLLHCCDLDWNSIKSKLMPVIEGLDRNGSWGSHGLTCPGSPFKGRPLESDFNNANKILHYLNEYFESPDERYRQFQTNNIFDKSSRNSLELKAVLDLQPPELIFFDDTGDETKLSDEFDVASWKKLFPSLSSGILEKFQSKRFNTHLDVLAEENLLEVGCGNLFFQSKSHKNDMFFLSKLLEQRERFTRCQSCKG